MKDKAKRCFRFVNEDMTSHQDGKTKWELGKCTQQVCYSTFHDALTQINFTKRIIRSNLQ